MFDFPAYISNISNYLKQKLGNSLFKFQFQICITLLFPALNLITKSATYWENTVYLTDVDDQCCREKIKSNHLHVLNDKITKNTTKHLTVQTSHPYRS